MKTFYSIAFILLANCFLFAQVGIDTETPDPSSALDVSSTDSGFLAPRMTTAQREAIVSPAQGLLVYDTTLESFQYYQNGWQTIAANNKRTNYKLVQSISDLADELTAGGGSTYELNTDFLYEINGTILVDFPIDLNGAYVEGVDSTEDILFNNSGSTLFQGSAGALRNMTIAGNGQQIFDISGSGTETFLVNSTIFSGGSSMGSLSDLGTAFFSITQYVSNSDGFDVSDISSFFVSNVFWTASNSGTFATLTGTFDNLQINGGRIETDSGETGIDVSANPTITNEAKLSGLSFVGDGTLIDGYTTGSYDGFNFTTNWTVESSGIPTETDEQATANFFSTAALTTGFTQSITDGTAVEIEGGGTFDNTELFRFRSNTENNRLIYEGQKTRNFQLAASLSVRVANAVGDFYTFLIAKNGVVVDDSDTLVQITSNTEIQSISINTVVTMETDDFVEVFVQRLTGTGTDTLVVFSENLTAR
ncbi:MAG: cell wall anchor protein [Bacteroidota bacterium]